MSLETVANGAPSRTGWLQSCYKYVMMHFQLVKLSQILSEKEPPDCLAGFFSVHIECSSIGSLIGTERNCV